MKIMNPRYIKNGCIDCEIEHPHFGVIPFTASPNDVEEHGRNIFAEAKAMGPAPYVPPSQEELDAIASGVVRAERDAKLRYEVDPAVSNPLRWADMTADQQQAWADYRTALLNVPQQDGFPHNVTWPVKPE